VVIVVVLSATSEVVAVLVDGGATSIGVVLD
jgi:hypothetical protein